MAQAILDDFVIPSHVAQDQVVDFDYMAPPGLDESGDVYRALARLHDGPDLQWTPRHGGHWLAMRVDDIKWIQESWELFSNTEKSPPRGSCPFMPPITFDPPDHTKYRAVLNPYFAKRRIEDGYEGPARKVIAELIEGLRPKGRCDFVAEFSVIAPLKIFWDFVDLPYDRREEFLTWGKHMAGFGTPQQRMEALQAVTGYLGGLLDERIEAPGQDIFTGISQWRNNPRFQRREEIVGMAQLVFFGGQDTVASAMAFAMWRLAEDPSQQQRLKDEPAVIPAAVEELIRRHGLSNTCRLVRRDVERKGAQLKAGELIMTLNPLSGVDGKAYPDPFKVDFDRLGPHNSFGNGPHKCVGQHLARLELRLFLEEWARTMPVARLDPTKPRPTSHAGPVVGVNHLHLAWEV